MGQYHNTTVQPYNVVILSPESQLAPVSPDNTCLLFSLYSFHYKNNNVEGLSLLQSIPPTMANKQFQAQWSEGGGTIKVLRGYSNAKNLTSRKN